VANPIVNVLVLIPTLDIGGVEVDLVRTLPLVARQRFNISVLTFLRRGTLADQLDAEGIRVISPPDQWPRRQGSRLLPQSEGHEARRLAALPLLQTVQKPLSAAMVGARIVRKLLDPNIDIVHTVLPNSYFYGALGNLLVHRRPLVMSRVSLNWYQEQVAMLRISERYLLHRAVAVAIANSRAVLRELRAEGIPESKLRLVHNGIDSRAFARALIDRQTARAQLGISGMGLVMSVVANLHTYKGHIDLLLALSGIRERLPPHWTLLAVGADIAGSMALLRRRAAELGLSGQVRFLGQRTDIATVLSASDLHLSASHTESLPNNILEAMCAGLPIIATNVGGVSEQLADGVSGVLVPARAPHQLAGAIERLVGDEELRLRLGREARDRVARAFPIEPVVAALEEIYGSLTPRHHDRVQ
jgi:glycosyltransferase involved in cell wall biosynthesis